MQIDFLNSVEDFSYEARDLHFVPFVLRKNSRTDCAVTFKVCLQIFVVIAFIYFISL